MRTLVVIALLFLFACEKEPPPPPPPAPAPPPTPSEPPPAKVEPVGEPVTFSPLTPSAVCTYELKEVLSEGIGDQLFAGHEVTITYELRAKEGPAIVFEAQVVRVQANARRASYTAKLDSQRAGDLRRIRGGADTLLMYEMVMPFAMLDRTVTIELDDRGHLRSFSGGDAVRRAMFEMHPPAPQKVPHYQKKIEVALSDEALLGYLMPSALAIPNEGPFASGRQETTKDVIFDRIEYVGRGSQGFRMSVRPDRWLLEQKRAYIPVEEVSSKVPPLPNAIAEVKLIQGSEDLTVEFEPKNPCFRKAGSATNDLAAWSGMVDETPTTGQRQRSITRIWQKK